MTGKMVLVVEDDYLVAEHIRDLLGRVGATATAVPSVSAALSVLERMSVDFATLDIDLRGETSLAVADLLSERRIPFLFVSGREPERLPERHRGRPFLPKSSLHRLPEACAACVAP